MKNTLLIMVFGAAIILSSGTSEITIGSVIQNGTWDSGVVPIMQRTIDLINLGAYKTELRNVPNININVTQSNHIVQTSTQVCDHVKSGAAAVIAYVSCTTSVLMDSQSRAMDVPQITVIGGPCRRLSPGSPTLKMVPHFSQQNNVLVDILQNQEWREAMILYDNSLDKIVLDDLMVQFSRASAIMRTINVEESRETLGDFTTVLKKAEKSKPVGIFLLVSETTLEGLYLAARTVGMLDKRHFWVVLIEYPTVATINMLASNHSNLILVRRSHPGRMIKDGQCDPIVHVPDWKGLWTNITHRDAYVIDAVLVMAKALGSFTERENSNMTVSPVDCKTDPFAKLQHGPDLIRLLKKTSLPGVSGNLTFTDEGYRVTSEFEICSSHYTETGSLSQTATWNPIKKLAMTDRQLFKNVFQDFDNRELVVTMREARPFVIKTVDEKTNKTVYSGFCVDILNELADYFKFAYRVIEPPDRLYGAPDEGGNWNGMVGMVVRGEVDFAVGPFTVTLLREGVIDFTQPFMEDGIGILTKKPEETDKMFTIFRPFTPRVWGIIALSACVVAALLYIVNRLSPNTAINQKREGANEEEINPISNLWAIYSSFVGQGSEPQPSAISGRLILGFWWVFVMLMVATYSADLTAFLTVTIALKPINSLTELTSQSQIKPLVKDGTNLYSLFKEAKGGVYSKVWTMMQGGPITNNNDESVGLVKTGQYAFMTDRSQLEYIVLQDCETYALADEIFNTAGLAYVLPENATFLKQFNYYIMRMQEAGLLEKWKQDWWPSSDQCNAADRTSEAETLFLDSMSGPFLVYAIVVGAAIVILALENFMKSQRMKKYRPHLKFWNFGRIESKKRKTSENGQVSKISDILN